VSVFLLQKVRTGAAPSSGRGLSRCTCWRIAAAVEHFMAPSSWLDVGRYDLAINTIVLVSDQAQKTSSGRG
jgi:hypothetical protein